MADDIQTFRDHFVSIYQSAVGDVARRMDQHAALLRSGPRPPSSENPSASSSLPGYAGAIARREFARRRGLAAPLAGTATPALGGGDTAEVCAELALRYLKACLSGDAAAQAQVEAEFKDGSCDPLWLTTFKEYLQYFGPDGTRKQVPYIRAANAGAKTIEIKANARVALVGDWGTGQQPAVQILQHIADAKPDVLVHLGDIYYSGTPVECASNFTAIVDKVLRGANPGLAAYTLAGNHDMYCGGVGYYGLIQNLNPAPSTQPASFFCLRSADEKWQLLAMDTGLHDYDPFNVDDAVTYLEDDELEWHCARIREFPGRTILLSHHQLFSAFSPIGKPDPDGVRSSVNPLLLKAFNSMAASGRISAWFWGHEHILSIYNAFAGLQRGRCLGHGAIPVPTLDDAYQPVAGLDQTPTLVANTQMQKQGSVYVHGYAILAFSPESCAAEYYQDLNGTAALVYSETID
jgi:Calcineurin-like phosphoesterase